MFAGSRFTRKFHYLARFEAEFRTAWLDRLGIRWNGSDLDDQKGVLKGQAE